ncbi:MAG: DHH family phosphoesterase [Candidatus Aenigmatarchaeota archaeon]|nr:DHH family phosphoesterase [Candidatus Aenigmarchaeota archaeon]
MYSKLKQAAELIKNYDKEITIVSHYDADGITAASIIAITLERLGKKYNIQILREIKPSIIDKIEKDSSDFIIFLDIGSGNLKFLNYLSKKHIIILDHHIPDIKEKENIIHVNTSEINKESITGSGLAWLLSKEIDEKNKDLVKLAIIGIVGDCHDVEKEFLENEFVKEEVGLKFFGRMSRPIHKLLEFSYEPYIPNITGNESAAIQFLSEINIPLKSDEKWRTLADLTEQELLRLADAIIKTTGYSDIFGKNYTIFSENKLYDAKEIATMLNACTRIGEIELAINFCKNLINGNIDNYLIKVQESFKIYRRILSNYLTWLRKNKDAVIILDNAVYINGIDVINSNFIGTINSIYIRKFNLQKPLITFAKTDDGIKVSARTLNGINIAEIISKCAKAVDGIGGGHKQAAGALIPYERLQDFIDMCENELEKLKTN